MPGRSVTAAKRSTNGARVRSKAASSKRVISPPDVPESDVEIPPESPKKRVKKATPEPNGYSPQADVSFSPSLVPALSNISKKLDFGSVDTPEDGVTSTPAKRSRRPSAKANMAKEAATTVKAARPKSSSTPIKKENIDEKGRLNLLELVDEETGLGTPTTAPKKGRESVSTNTKKISFLAALKAQGFADSSPAIASTKGKAKLPPPSSPPIELTDSETESDLTEEEDNDVGSPMKLDEPQQGAHPVKDAASGEENPSIDLDEYDVDDSFIDDSPIDDEPTPRQKAQKNRPIRTPTPAPVSSDDEGGLDEDIQEQVQEQLAILKSFKRSTASAAKKRAFEKLVYGQISALLGSLSNDAPVAGPEEATLEPSPVIQDGRGPARESPPWPENLVEESVKGESDLNLPELGSCEFRGFRDANINPDELSWLLLENLEEHLDASLYKTLEAAETFETLYPFVNFARADPSLFAVDAHRVVWADKRKNAVGIMLGSVAHANIVNPHNYSASSDSGYVVKRIAITPTEMAFRRFGGFLQAKYNRDAVKAPVEWGSELSFATRKQGVAATNGSTPQRKKDARFFGSKKSAAPSASWYTSAQGFPPFLDFDADVPVYDARGQDFTFDKGSFDRLNTLPKHKPAGRNLIDLPKDSLVAVGFTANMFGFDAANSDACPTLSLNLQFVVYLGNLI